MTNKAINHDTLVKNFAASKKTLDASLKTK